MRCPCCEGLLGALPGADGPLRCSACTTCYRQVDGIWRFLLPDRLAAFQPFLAEFATVRRAEGRGSADPTWYLALPDVAPDHQLAWQWRVRAASWRCLADRVLPFLGPAPLRVADLGAGNCWLSYRLAVLGHHPMALDIWADGRDGLGAGSHYDAALLQPFPRVQAEFDRLPLADSAADVVLFNASVHYSADYDRTLTEALRALRSDGVVVIMDSPVYRSVASGRAMTQARMADYQARFGFPSNALGSREFLTEDDLAVLAEGHDLDWWRVQPWYGWRWWLRPWRARLTRRREPARFTLLIGRRRGEKP